MTSSAYLRVRRARPVGMILTVACLFMACEGPMGPKGRRGPEGPRGPQGDARDAGGMTLPEAGLADAGVDAGGEAFSGLFGNVRDASGSAVTAGRVYLVPTSEVARLAATPVDLTVSAAQAALASNDELLEDVIDLAGDSLASAEIDGEGSYKLAVVPEGSFFVVYKPALTDLAHLPGGDAGRTPRAAETLRGVRLDLTVSSTPSPDARYVGSSPCVTCHARHTSFASAHALTLRVPGQSSPMQDVSEVPRIDEALGLFRAGTTLYFYDCATGREPLPACRVSSAPPVDSASIRMRVRLGRDPVVAEGAPGAFYVELENQGGSDVQRYPVLLTLGGALSYQQYVTRVSLPDGTFTHLTLPFSYQLAGDDSRPSYRDYRWVAYRAEDWLSFSDGSLRRPALAESFDRQCAGCHVTGFSLSGDATQGFHAAAVAERDGIFDLDGDGRKELLAVGCESCHGPGSEHVERTPRGQHIVSPQLLTPERQVMLCGTCHSRHRGVGGSFAPLDATLHMPQPGLRRSEFLAQHTSAIENGDDVFFPSGDSRLGFQQYSDFLRSSKHRNADLMTTCSDCHASHREAGLPSDLLVANDDPASCAGCHREPQDIHAHALDKVGYDHVRGVDQAALTCVRCHMVKTATASAGVPGLVDEAIPGRTVRYFSGDRTSHRFVFVDRTQIDTQPIAATDSCGFCHSAVAGP